MPAQPQSQGYFLSNLLHINLLHTTIALGSFQGIICETDNIEAGINELTEKGIQAGKIDGTPWGKFACLKDLDGNSLCLHQR